MIRKVTAILMFVAASVNTLSWGACEGASQCAAAEDGVSVTASASHSEQAQITIASTHEEPDNCGSCHHEGARGHQCHFGHCQCVIIPSKTSLQTPDAQSRHANYIFYWLTTEHSSLERPPRI